MRQFVVLGHEAPTHPDFDLDDLAGGAGRLDLLCRCVNAGLLTSHGIREDARVWLVIDDAVTVRFEGADLRGLHPDERAIAGLVRSALDAARDAVGHRSVEASPGVAASSRGLEPVLSEVAADGTVIHLHEDGAPIADRAPPDDPIFLLSDHRSVTAAEADRVAAVADRRARLGPVAVHADHAVAVAGNYCDTGGFERY
ncbi:MAG: tRNA (pseudouridine(54)-N(1))-methyltransferase TrmY [Halobacteriaceae archaeon]